MFKDLRIERDSTPILDSNLSTPELMLANFISKESDKSDFSTTEIYDILQTKIVGLPKENIDNAYLRTVTLAVFIKSCKLFLISKEEPVLRQTDDIQKWIKDRKRNKIDSVRTSILSNKSCDYTEESISFLKVYLLGSEKTSFTASELKAILSDVKSEYATEVTVDYYYMDKLCQKMYTELGCLYYLKKDTILKAVNEQDWHINMNK